MNDSLNPKQGTLRNPTKKEKKHPSFLPSFSLDDDDDDNNKKEGIDLAQTKNAKSSFYLAL